MQLKESDKVEILTLQDNYIDLVEAPANVMVTREMDLETGMHHGW